MELGVGLWEEWENNPGDWGSGVASAVAAWSPSLCGLTLQVGITLHYSSLSTLLWMGVKARVLHKELTWRAPPPQEGDLAPPAPRPMLRYLPPVVSFARVKGSEARPGEGQHHLFSQAGGRAGPRSWVSTLQREKRQSLGWCQVAQGHGSGCVLRAFQG